MVRAKPFALLKNKTATLHNEWVPQVSRAATPYRHGQIELSSRPELRRSAVAGPAVPFPVLTHPFSSPPPIAGCPPPRFPVEVHGVPELSVLGRPFFRFYRFFLTFLGALTIASVLNRHLRRLWRIRRTLSPALYAQYALYCSAARRRAIACSSSGVGRRRSASSR
jgi:hypothetical protein